MSRILYRAMIVFVILGIGNVARTRAQSFPWVDEVPCIKNPKQSMALPSGDGNFLLCFDYNPMELTPGPNQEDRVTPLTIRVYTERGKVNAQLISISPPESSGYPGIIVTPRSGPVIEQLKLCTANTYVYDITIQSQARPRPYPIRLNLFYKGVRVEAPPYNLPVYGKGLLAGSNDNPAMISCWTGQQRDLTFGVENKSSYSPLTVKQVTVGSTPDDLVEPDTVRLAEERYVGNYGEPAEVKIPIKLKRMSPMQMLFGFGKSPKLNLRIEYNDDYGRPYYLPLNFDLDLKPEPVYLVVALLIGALLGTMMRFDLYRLEKGGFISRRQTVGFAVGAVITGLIISIVAIAANLKLVMFGDQAGYSSFDPRLLLLIALVGTMGGVAILNPFLPLSKNKPLGDDQQPEDKLDDDQQPEDKKVFKKVLKRKRHA